MADFFPLFVTDLRKTTKDAVVVTLEPNDGGNFDFIQGQYLTFKRDFEGTEIRRSYSICSGRDEPNLQIGVKQVEGGVFSTWVNTELKVGDQLYAMEPKGNFHTPVCGESNNNYLLFAGGSGITPMMSILKTVLLKEPMSRFTIVYANRSVSSIMFREELEDLKNSHMGRVRIVHILEQDSQDIELFGGMLTEEKCKQLLGGWIEPALFDAAFICGPEPMMHGVTKALKSHGFADDKIKYELFSAQQSGKIERKPKRHKDNQQTEHELAVFIDGTQRLLKTDGQTSILEAALANQVDVPFACKAGVCSTCMCRLVKGDVEMIANHALEDYEVEQGYILSCQSYPRSAKIVVDYDNRH